MRSPLVCADAAVSVRVRSVRGEDETGFPRGGGPPGRVRPRLEFDERTALLNDCDCWRILLLSLLILVVYAATTY